MRFAQAGAGHLFWLILVLSVFFFLVNKERKKTLKTFTNESLLPQLNASFDMRKYIFKRALIIAAIGLIILALMRPQWGFKTYNVTRRGLDIIVAVDTSKSMLAQDIKPSRLERAKLALRDFVKNLKGDRIGLVAFAGSAFTQCPLTVDYNGFLLSAEALDTNIIPQGGTCISEAIKQAQKSFEGGLKKYKALVIITDGEDHQGDTAKAAETAKNEGVKIFCIGIGTNEGELIPITDEKDDKTFLKDRDGNVVKSRLDETGLQNIALATGGSYIRATSKEFGLNIIYKEKLSNMEKKDLESKITRQYYERFQIPLFLAFLLLAIEFFMGETRRETGGKKFL